MKRVCVTGANGFVGQFLARSLLSSRHPVIGAVRSTNLTISESGLPYVVVGDNGKESHWSEALTRIDCVIHCAARAHVMHETAGDALGVHRSVNVAGSRRLAEQAAAVGVRSLCT